MLPTHLSTGSSDPSGKECSSSPHVLGSRQSLCRCRCGRGCRCGCSECLPQLPLRCPCPLPLPSQWGALSSTNPHEDTTAAASSETATTGLAPSELGTRIGSPSPGVSIPHFIIPWGPCSSVARSCPRSTNHHRPERRQSGTCLGPGQGTTSRRPRRRQTPECRSGCEPLGAIRISEDEDTFAGPRSGLDDMTRHMPRARRTPTRDETRLDDTRRA